MSANKLVGCVPLLLDAISYWCVCVRERDREMERERERERERKCMSFDQVFEIEC